jgi:hypothetical protein
MAPTGRKPKPRGQAVTRHQPAHGWTDVDPVPFDGPPLPDHRRNGTPWPQWMTGTWETWRTMPHAVLWRASDWEFALDTAELASRAYDDRVKIGLLTELRYREKVLATTWSARQDQRLRYIQPESSPPASVSALDDYRDL